MYILHVQKKWAGLSCRNVNRLVSDHALVASRDTETGLDWRPPGRCPFWEPWRVRGLGRPWRSGELGQPWQVRGLGRPWRIGELGWPWWIRGLRRPWRIGDLGWPWRVRGLGRPWRSRELGRPWRVRGLGRPWRIGELGRPPWRVAPPKKNYWGNSSSLGGSLEAWSLGALGRRTEPAGALGSRTEPAGALGSRTEPAGALGSQTEPARALESRTAGALESRTEPAGALESWTGPAGVLESWTEPAGALESTGEEQALEGAREAQRLGGALAAQRLGSALAAQTLRDAPWAATGGRCLGAGTGFAVVGGGLGGATDDGRRVLARGRTLSRHRRIPSLQHSPLESGRSRGRWELAQCKNRERMVASSNAIAAASPQNSREYSGKGRSWWARAMKRAAISISVKEVLLGPVFCHGARGSQERGGEELLLNTLF